MSISSFSICCIVWITAPVLCQNSIFQVLKLTFLFRFKLCRHESTLFRRFCADFMTPWFFSGRVVTPRPTGLESAAKLLTHSMHPDYVFASRVEILIIYVNIVLKPFQEPQIYHTIDETLFKLEKLEDTDFYKKLLYLTDSFICSLSWHHRKTVSISWI